MGTIGKHKLADALKPTEGEAQVEKGGKGTANAGTTAEQIREASESLEAKDAEASIRDRMVEIGRGNQQAGRQGQ